MDTGQRSDRSSKVLGFASVCVALVATQAAFGFYSVLYTKLAKGTETEPLVFCLYRDVGCTPVLFLAAYVAEKRILLLQKRYEYLHIYLLFISMRV